MTERMIAVVGRTGFGKSTVLRKIISARDRVLLLEQDFSKAKDWPDFEWFTTWAELFSTMRQVRPRAFRIGFVPGSTHFADCLRLAWALGDITVVIEEAGKYFPYRNKPARHQMPAVMGGNMTVPGEFMEICERGRHAGPRAPNTPVSIVAVSQRPKRLPLCLQAELERVYAFRLNLGHDRRWLAECPGSDDALAEETKTLPQFHFLNIDANGGLTRETTTP